MPITRLTKRFCDTVRAAGSRIEVRDEKVRGLELRVSPSGIKSWALRYRRHSDHRQRILFLGRYPERTLEEARDAAEEARRVIARGGDPANQQATAKTAPTFREVAADWQRYYAPTNRSKRVRDDDRSVLGLYILPAIGDMKAHVIQRIDIARMLGTAKLATDQRRGHISKGDRPRTLTHRPNKVFEIARAIFRWAVGEGILSSDPTAGMKRPIKLERPRERTLSLDEIRIVWNALELAPGTRERWKKQPGELPFSRAIGLAMQLSLVTAQRIGEVAGISIAELDLNEFSPTWTLPGSRTKNGETHRVPLSQVARKLIDEARKLAGSDSAWLFPNPTRNGSIDPHAPTRALSRARALIGVVDFRVHDLRRTAATRMEELGIGPHVISHVLNHISVRKGSITSKVYARHTYDQEKRAALNLWGSFIERILKSNSNNVLELHHAMSLG